MIVRRSVLGISLLAVLAVPFLLGSVRSSGRIIVPEGEVLSEDLYAFGSLVVVDGTIEGDLFVVAGQVRITGLIDGDLIGLVGGPVRVSGEVTGSVRVTAVDVEVSGTVGDDLAAVAAETSVGGTVGRDVLLVVGAFDLGGSIGRDARVRALRMEVDGDVGRDVHVTVDSLTLGATAAVAGDVLYVSGRPAAVESGAGVTGQLTRRTTLSPVWERAVTRAIAILSVGAVIVGGLAAAWLFPATSRRSLQEVGAHPWRSAGVGVAMLVGLPLVALPLFLTLVGIPVALFLVLAWLVAVVLGPIPAVTEVGSRLIRRRGGVALGLVVGVLAWRTTMWLLPLVAGFVYVGTLVLGLGAFARAGWFMRRERRI